MRLLFVCMFIVPSLLFADALPLEGWQRLEEGQVDIFHRPEDAFWGAQVMDWAQESSMEISHHLGYFISPPVHIVLAADMHEFTLMTQGQIPDWGVAAADPSRGTVFLKSPRFSGNGLDLAGTIAHEISHVILYKAAGNRALPRWFDEGFAQMESHESSFHGSVLLARQVFAGRVFALKDIDDVLTFRKDKAALAYEMSLSAVVFLRKLCGPEGFIPVIRALNRGGTMEEAIREGTGLGFRDFEIEWSDYIKRKYRWYLFLDYPAMFSLTILILFVLALFVRHQKNEERLRSWKEEEIENSLVEEMPAQD